MYDFVIAGAGISAATFAALMKKDYRICVVDVRPHIGGNCYDYKADSEGTYVHMYGPHYFHTANMEIVNFLSGFTEWRPYEHKVTAEIKLNDEFLRVPFPYSQETAKVIGRELSEEEVINLFFKSYSQKMWGKPFDDLPAFVKGRVPKDTKENSNYFPGQFVGLPTKGYTHMMENMFDGVDFVLSADPNCWLNIPAKRRIYCGRPDRLDPLLKGVDLEWRNLRFKHKIEDWDSENQVINFCHENRQATRATSQGMVNGTNNRIVTYEYPYEDKGELVPFYPVNTEENKNKMKKIKSHIAEQFPNVDLLGRLGTYTYIDMHQAVGQAMNLAKKYGG